MARLYMVSVTTNKKPPSAEAMKDVLGPLKDWLRLAPGTWLVYSELSASSIRDRLRDKFTGDGPCILVLGVDKAGWAAHATELVRNWIKSDHAEHEGE